VAARTRIKRLGKPLGSILRPSMRRHLSGSCEIAGRVRSTDLLDLQKIRKFGDGARPKCALFDTGGLAVGEVLKFENRPRKVRSMLKAQESARIRAKIAAMTGREVGLRRRELARQLFLPPVSSRIPWWFRPENPHQRSWSNAEMRQIEARVRRSLGERSPQRLALLEAWELEYAELVFESSARRARYRRPA
jgi:hypothetical protein